MLVLSRKPGERIVVPHCELSVTIVAIEGGRVRLGISAPKQVDVYRDEVWRAICQRDGEFVHDLDGTAGAHG